MLESANITKNNMGFRFHDPEGDERMKKGLHPASGKPIGGGLEKNIKKDLAITPNKGIGSKSKALHKKMGKGVKKDMSHLTKDVDPNGPSKNSIFRSMRTL